ncbi:hypothetical protein GCM10011351_00800 [Paraliobacillus quinghaiensis]|uniref:HEAT repeat domain-containing protein n=1 Tax=Paraliobacillus quinghaiensis TaxID=470815 RepID=A0A917TDF7_9BACI|nr:hypothetical protein [Paraliobacillus quinghaiensis]GGM18854.1 hypothetical protein GCM10011351_00800 [Paraliobacillus quinghaiensis]
MLTTELSVLSVLMIFVVTLLTVLLGYLLIRKARENKVRKRINNYKEKYRVPVYDYLSSGEVTRLIEPIGKDRKLAIEELLRDFSDILEGEETRLNLSNYAERHLSELYRENLTSRQWSNRMNTLYYIEDFYMKNLEADVQKEILDNLASSKDEIIQSLCVLARFNSPKFKEYIELKHEELLEFDLRNILRRVEEEQLDYLIDRFENYSLNLQCAILERISQLKNLEYVTFLESTFEKNSGEVKLRALKTLANLGYVEDITRYMPLCDSPVWQERMLVAKLFKMLQDNRTISCLKKLLHDEYWWVRQQAGDTIASFPNGNEILIEVIEQSQDNYAKDMAREWLNKGVLT